AASIRPLARRVDRPEPPPPDPAAADPHVASPVAAEREAAPRLPPWPRGWVGHDGALHPRREAAPGGCTRQLAHAPATNPDGLPVHLGSPTSSYEPLHICSCRKDPPPAQWDEPSWPWHS